MEENPGYTFDALENLMINEIYWGFERRRMRLDRILFFASENSTLKVNGTRLCFNEPIYCEKKQSILMWFGKGAVAFIFDRFGTSIFR